MPLASVPAPMAEALRVPAFAAAVWYHHRPGDARGEGPDRVVDAAARFAVDTLGPALARAGGPRDRSELRRALANQLGVSPSPGDSGGVRRRASGVTG